MRIHLHGAPQEIKPNGNSWELLSKMAASVAPATSVAKKSWDSLRRRPGRYWIRSPVIWVLCTMFFFSRLPKAEEIMNAEKKILSH